MKKPANPKANKAAAKTARKVGAKPSGNGKAARQAVPAGKKSDAARSAADTNAQRARDDEATRLKRKELLTTAERKRLLELAPRPADTRWPSEIAIGQRFRKDFGDIAALARSINARGVLMHRIPVDVRAGQGQDLLIAGERRLRAWQHPTCDFRDSPIPVNAVSIDSVARGEWDENDPALRKDFTPEEMVALKRALEPKLKEAAAERIRAGKKADKPGATGRTTDIVGKMAGKSGRTVEKAEKILQAHEAAPDDTRIRQLVDDMNRTGRVDGPFKRLEIIQKTAELRAAPPSLPMNGPYGVIEIDFSWPFEADAEQDEIDAKGRSLRPYPAMSIKEGCKLFAGADFQKQLADDCIVLFWTTNHHMLYAYQLLQAMGFRRFPTILTWNKVKIGRGKWLREVTEHVIVAVRGNPLVNLTNQTTLLTIPRGENSRKPDEFYALVEEVFPASRYASYFSGGGRGDTWDCHGEPSRIADGDTAKDANASAAPMADPGRFVQGDLRKALERTEQGLGVVVDFDLTAAGFRQYVIGARKLKLNKAGQAKLKELRAGDPAKPVNDVVTSPADVAGPATAPCDDNTVVPFHRREEGAA